MAPSACSWGWWRELFVDHPGVATKSADRFAGNKHKVWYARCFSAHIAAGIAQDESEVTAGIWTSIRDQQTIENTCALMIVSYVFKFRLQMIY